MSEPKMLTREEIEAAWSRANAADPPPWSVKWEFNVVDKDGKSIAACGGRASNFESYYERNVANAIHIAAARTDIPALCATALHYIAEVEGLERDNADLSAYADEKEAEVKRFMAEVERLRPIVDAARNGREHWRYCQCNACDRLLKAMEEAEGE